MSNPWAQSFEDLRSPYLDEKKAQKDHDGDGKVESGSKEHAGAVHNAIQRAKGGKADGKDTRQEAFSMAADPEKRAIPRATRKAENKKGMSARSRAVKAVGTQRRQDKETGISGEKNPRAYREETVAEDAKMAKQSDEKLSALHKQVTSSDQSLPSNQFMLKRVQKEMNRRKKVTKEETAIEEGSMKQARKNVGASTCWDGYKAKGTKKKGSKVVPNCVKEHSSWREEMGEGFFSEAAKTEKLDIQTSGIKNKIEINPTLKSEGVDTRRAPAELVARLSAKTPGWMADDGPNKPASDAKARVMAKTKKKREQAKENIMKGPVLPGEARKVFPKGSAPKATGAKLPLVNSHNPLLDSVEDQALELIEKKKGLWANIHAKRERGESPAKKGDKDYPKTLNVEGVSVVAERTRYAKEKGTDSQTGKESKSGGTIKPGSAMSKVRKNLAGQGLMSSRGKAIQPQGKKKEKGAKGYQGVTPVDKIKGTLARKRAPKPNPYKARAGESD